MGFKPKPPHHDAARSDTNHPTRAGTFKGLESGRFQGWEFKGFWGKVVRGLFAASLKGARGVSAAFVHSARGVSAAFLSNARGATAVFCSNARGAHFRTPAVPPVRVRPFVSSSVREQVGSLLCRSGRSEVRRCNARAPCVPPEPPTACDRPAANSSAFSVDSCTVLIFGSSAAMGGFTQWADRQKGGGDGHRAPRPGSRGGGSSRRVPTPKGSGHQAPRGDDWNRGESTPRGRGRQAHHGKGRRARTPAEELERKLVRLSATANSGSAARLSAGAI